ncbi:MAG: hypothetical protein IKJ44_04230 [Elusimicrobiaceae bacterium]|nr:hypothetical protein [Elusimicrobiaceae bacterium]MBR3899461.1 hypothetical protein [Elusimicrobiaceae bacterium]
MQYILFFAGAVLAGMVLQKCIPQKYKKYAWGYWAAFALFCLQTAVFAPYRYQRMWWEIKNLLG